MWVTREHVEHMIKDTLLFTISQIKMEEILDCMLEIYPYKTETYGEGKNDYIIFYDVSQVPQEVFKKKLLSLVS